jgi:hypothetical protein
MERDEETVLDLKEILADLKIKKKLLISAISKA